MSAPMCIPLLIGVVGFWQLDYIKTHHLGFFAEQNHAIFLYQV